MMGLIAIPAYLAFMLVGTYADARMDAHVNEMYCQTHCSELECTSDCKKRLTELGLYHASTDPTTFISVLGIWPSSGH